MEYIFQNIWKISNAKKGKHNNSPFFWCSLRNDFFLGQFTKQIILPFLKNKSEPFGISYSIITVETRQLESCLATAGCAGECLFHVALKKTLRWRRMRLHCEALIIQTTSIKKQAESCLFKVAIWCDVQCSWNLLKSCSMCCEIACCLGTSVTSCMHKSRLCSGLGSPFFNQSVFSLAVLELFYWNANAN